MGQLENEKRGTESRTGKVYFFEWQSNLNQFDILFWTFPPKLRIKHITFSSVAEFRLFTWLEVFFYRSVKGFWIWKIKEIMKEENISSFETSPLTLTHTAPPRWCWLVVTSGCLWGCWPWEPPGSGAASSMAQRRRPTAPGSYGPRRPLDTPAVCSSVSIKCWSELKREFVSGCKLCSKWEVIESHKVQAVGYYMRCFSFVWCCIIHKQ